MISSIKENRISPEYITECNTFFSDYDFEGNLHFSKYFSFFEQARFEFAHRVGIFGEKYADLVFPVIEVKCNYIEKINIDNNFILRTAVEFPLSGRLVFHHIISDKDTDKIYASADTAVAIVSKKKGLMISVDTDIKNKIIEYVKTLKGAIK